jgi:carotene epsilon-monooxygenase
VSFASRQTTEELIAKCKAMVDAEEAASFEEGYINDSDPSGGAQQQHF